jgi:drug/metabolite transporter (DMT)-like permease
MMRRVGCCTLLTYRDGPSVGGLSRRPPLRDLGLLCVAVLSISSSAILVRWAEAPALALAFWRTFGGAVILGPAAFRSDVRPGRSSFALLMIAGLALALHFGVWLASLERTSVAASVTLVTTVPIFIAGWEWLRGRSPSPRTWVAIAITLTGAAVVTGGDALFNPGSLDGDTLALIGAIAMAVYLLVGDRLRNDLPTVSYAAPTYAIAATVLLVAALVSGTTLTGFNTQTWLAIGAMILGPQLGGHTVLNLLLAQLGSLTVSLALLAEPIGASTLAWLFFNEVPTVSVVLGAPLVLTGLFLQVTSKRDPSPESRLCT